MLTSLSKIAHRTSAQCHAGPLNYSVLDCIISWYRQQCKYTRVIAFHTHRKLCPAAWYHHISGQSPVCGLHDAIINHNDVTKDPDWSCNTVHPRKYAHSLYFVVLCLVCTLTHWCRDKMAAILQMTLSNAFVPKRPILQRMFRLWFGADQATSPYLNQCWPDSLTHIYGNRGRWVDTEKNITNELQTMLLLPRDILQSPGQHSDNLFKSNGLAKSVITPNG